MRKAWLIIAGAAVLWGTGGPAAAFQEMPPAPPMEQEAVSPEAAANPPAVPPAVQLQTKEAPSKGGSKGLSVPGLGKLDFGLELLYGSQQQQALQDPQQGQGPISDQAADDVKVLGTVRRRF